MAELDSSEVESYLLGIFSGLSYNSFNRKGKNIYVMFKHPTSEVKLKAGVL